MLRGPLSCAKGDCPGASWQYQLVYLFIHSGHDPQAATRAITETATNQRPHEPNPNILASFRIATSGPRHGSVGKCRTRCAGIIAFLLSVP